MRKYSSNLSFVDMLFNLLIGFTSLFILSFLLINPIADEGKIDPVTEFMLVLEWPDHLPTDLDIHVKTPMGDIISFRHKDAGWIVLDRDDLGASNDAYMVNGEKVIVKKNMEVVNINAIVPGEYFVNVHYYGRGAAPFWSTVSEDLLFHQDATTYSLRLMDMHPFDLSYTVDAEGLGFRAEHTVVSFIVTEDGSIEDIRNDIQVKLYVEGGG